jgi:hypothetical protein
MSSMSFGRISRGQLVEAFKNQRPVEGRDKVPFLIEDLVTIESRSYPKLDGNRDEVVVIGKTTGKDADLERMYRIQFPKNQPDAVTDRLSLTVGEAGQ